MSKFPKTVLTILAHPDDAEAYCGGTLKLLRDRGYRIVISTMTAGGMGGIGLSEDETAKVRKEEAREAASVIGAEYYCFNRRDGYLFDNEKIRIETTNLIRKVKAGIVFTHLPFDYHSDHRTAANIAEIASMFATLPNAPCAEKPLDITPLLYHVTPLGYSDQLGNRPPDPSFFVNITGAIATKAEMLSHHKSQIELMRLMHRVDDFFGEMKKQNMKLGNMIGVKYAEAFWQHFGGGFQKDLLIQTELQDFIKTLKALK